MTWRDPRKLAKDWGSLVRWLYIRASLNPRLLAFGPPLDSGQSADVQRMCNGRTATRNP